MTEQVWIGPWLWHGQDRSLRHADTRVPLTRLERAALDYLIRRAGQDVPTTDLLREVWGYGPRAQSRAVAKLICRLRRKLGPAGRCVVTVFGVGYRVELGGGHPVRRLPDFTHRS